MAWKLPVLFSIPTGRAAEKSLADGTTIKIQKTKKYTEKTEIQTYSRKFFSAKSSLEPVSMAWGPFVLPSRQLGLSGVPTTLCFENFVDSRSLEKTKTTVIVGHFFSKKRRLKMSDPGVKLRISIFYIDPFLETKTIIIYVKLYVNTKLFLKLLYTFGRYLDIQWSHFFITAL